VARGLREFFESPFGGLEETYGVEEEPLQRKIEGGTIPYLSKSGFAKKRGLGGVLGEKNKGRKGNTFKGRP